VCALNGETYSNECTAWAAGLPVDYEGACQAVGPLFSKYSRYKSLLYSILGANECPKPTSRQVAFAFDSRREIIGKSQALCKIVLFVDRIYIRLESYNSTVPLFALYNL